MGLAPKDLRSPLCVALDSSDPKANLRIARATEAHAGVFKVGLTSFLSGGQDLVSELAALGPVFLDLKLHDIPAQVAGAVRAVAASGAKLTTVHGVGGADMLRAAVEAAADDIAILAVTVLTSLDDAALARVGIAAPAQEAVVRLAELALGAGVGGLVCSPREVEALRTRFGPRPLLVVPGIRRRDDGDPADDQRRTWDAASARAAGADVLVVGRPITGAAVPAAAAAAMLVEMGA